MTYSGDAAHHLEAMSLENAAPDVHTRAPPRPVLPEEEDDDVEDAFDAREIFGAGGSRACV